MTDQEIILHSLIIDTINLWHVKPNIATHVSKRFLIEHPIALDDTMLNHCGTAYYVPIMLRTYHIKASKN